MILLVTGSRDWTDESIVCNALDAALADDSDLILIEGEARGADSIAASWARERGLDRTGRLRSFPAHWQHRKDCPDDCLEVIGRAAGVLRNRKMLVDGKPSRVYAFSNDLSSSTGTLNMCYQASTAGVPVYWFDADGVEHRLTSREIGDWFRARKVKKTVDKQERLL